MATQPQVTAGGPRQLVLVAALVAVLLLIVGLLVVRPMLGGTEEGQAPPPAATAGAAPATTTPQLIGPSTSVTPSGDPGGSVKDPFRPLVSAGSVAAATESGVTADGDARSVTPSTVAATGSTVAGAGAGTATTLGGSSAERQVALVSITGGTAKVTVDGTSYTVEEGESFASGYRAVDINSECASFESGTTS
ncbi:MAG TPA: hypothetical protein VEY96_00435, partial [Actinomycetes bacterium]|nr:hypothetical protein [Actinomycetes bacterium]